MAADLYHTQAALSPSALAKSFEDLSIRLNRDCFFMGETIDGEITIKAAKKILGSKEVPFRGIRLCVECENRVKVRKEKNKFDPKHEPEADISSERPLDFYNFLNRLMWAKRMTVCGSYGMTDSIDGTKHSFVFSAAEGTMIIPIDTARVYPKNQGKPSSTDQSLLPKMIVRVTEEQTTKNPKETLLGEVLVDDIDLLVKRSDGGSRPVELKLMRLGKEEKSTIIIYAKWVEWNKAFSYNYSEATTRVIEIRIALVDEIRKKDYFGTTSVVHVECFFCDRNIEAKDFPAGLPLPSEKTALNEGEIVIPFNIELKDDGRNLPSSMRGWDAEEGRGWISEWSLNVAFDIFNRKGEVTAKVPIVVQSIMPCGVPYFLNMPEWGIMDDVHCCVMRKGTCRSFLVFDRMAYAVGEAPVVAGAVVNETRRKKLELSISFIQNILLFSGSVTSRGAGVSSNGGGGGYTHSERQIWDKAWVLPRKSSMVLREERLPAIRDVPATYLGYDDKEWGSVKDITGRVQSVTEFEKPALSGCHDLDDTPIRIWYHFLITIRINSMAKFLRVKKIPIIVGGLPLIQTDMAIFPYSRRLDVPLSYLLLAPSISGAPLPARQPPEMQSAPIDNETLMRHEDFRNAGGAPVVVGGGDEITGLNFLLATEDRRLAAQAKLLVKRKSLIGTSAEKDEDGRVMVMDLKSKTSSIAIAAVESASRTDLQPELKNETEKKKQDPFLEWYRERRVLPSSLRLAGQLIDLERFQCAFQFSWKQTNHPEQREKRVSWLAKPLFQAKFVYTPKKTFSLKYPIIETAAPQKSNPLTIRQYWDLFIEDESVQVDDS